MVFWIFKRKKERESETKITTAFSKVDADILHIQQWISHLHKNQQEIHGRHSVYSLITKKEMSELRQWLSFLHEHTSSLHSQVNRALLSSAELKKEISTLNERISRLESIKEEKARQHSNNKNKPEISGNNSNKQNQIVTPQLHGVIEESNKSDMLNSKTTVINTSQFGNISSSEKGVLMQIYGSSIPITYSQIAERTNLNYGTVKNIIYRLRKKGIAINNQINPDGEKEFFLTKTLKIELSGR